VTRFPTRCVAPLGNLRHVDTSLSHICLPIPQLGDLICMFHKHQLNVTRHRLCNRYTTKSATTQRERPVSAFPTSRHEPAAAGGGSTRTRRPASSPRECLVLAAHTAPCVWVAGWPTARMSDQLSVCMFVRVRPSVSSCRAPRSDHIDHTRRFVQQLRSRSLMSMNTYLECAQPRYKRNMSWRHACAIGNGVRNLLPLRQARGALVQRGAPGTPARPCRPQESHGRAIFCPCEFAY
jgi:hypothetical protein